MSFSPLHSRRGLEADGGGRSESTMFEAVAMTVSDEMRRLSSGVLQCLPYSRALLDFFEKRGFAAKPLVVRGVVFGQHPTIDWANPEHMKLVNSFFRTAISTPDANGHLLFTLPAADGSAPVEVNLPYRTIGFTHGAAPPGSYHTDGSWYGHLVVIAENAMIDLTIGQLNDPRFSIGLSPPYGISETDEGFLV